MDIENVVQDLNKKFAEPLPAYYNRRIIIWKDEDGEFSDKLEGMELENAKLIVLDGHNQFLAKKLIARDEKDSNLVIYSPISYNDKEDNWLLDVEFYSGEPVRYDLLSSWLRDMNMDNTPAIREEVKKLRSYFNKAPHRRKVTALNKVISKPQQVAIVVLAGLCGEKEPTPSNILRRVMSAGIRTEDNVVYQAILKEGVQDAFWHLVAQTTGYDEGELNSIESMAAHIIVTACAQTLPQEYLRGLENYISTAYKSSCYDIIHRWLASQDKAQYEPVAEYVEEELCLAQRFMKFDAASLTDTESIPCLDNVILTKLMEDISNSIINPAMIQEIINRRKTTAWYENVSDFYEGILQVANMHEFFTTHVENFHTVEPQKVWEEYTQTYYKMDTYYRHFHCCYANVKMSPDADLEDGFKSVVEVAERLYTGWFVSQLGSNWSNACAADMGEHGHILDIPQQTDFYRSYFFSTSPATAVIISDALRYEVAVELAKQLEQENHGKVSIGSCEAIFPSVTKYGMAALLPHKELSIKTGADGSLSILADGMPTDMQYREKVLKATNEKSKVIRYCDFVDMASSERREATKGLSVLYFYHDTIDDAGHAGDASKVLQACARTIMELKKLVRDIVNSNISRIIITSDHGFLYTDGPIRESDKIAKSSFNSDIVEEDPRYVIVNKGIEPSFLMPVKYMDGTTDYNAFAPRDSIRIAAGGPKNYVHGGASLQELVVPVIEFNNLKTTAAEFKKNKDKFLTKDVSIEILSSARKTSNMIIPVNFFQKEAVSSNRSATEYSLYFEDSNGNIISDVQTWIADKEDADIRNRQFRLTFNLKQAKYSKFEKYYLVIEDKSTKQECRQETTREPYEIDIAFALGGDFDFFS